MRRIPLHVLRDSESLAREAAEAFVRVCAGALVTRERIAVALTGGTTPRRLFELLASSNFRGRIEWSRLHFFWSDERAVPIGDPRSNYVLAWESLLRHVPVPPANVHRLEGERDPDDAAAAAQADLVDFFGARGAPPAALAAACAFDLALLGVGEDGHVASLFPGCDEIEETGHLVVATRQEHVVMRRMTFTLPLLANAHAHLFLVSGEKKCDAVHQVFRSISAREGILLDVAGVSARSPALRLTHVAKAPLWLVDEAAASLVPRTSDSESRV